MVTVAKSTQLKKSKKAAHIAGNSYDDENPAQQKDGYAMAGGAPENTCCIFSSMLTTFLLTTAGTLL